MYNIKKEIIGEYGRKYNLIEGYIPNNYSIWNAHLLKTEGKTFLKLYNNDRVVNYTVDVDSLLALEVSEELGEIIDKHLAGGRNPQEVKKGLKSKDNYIKRHAEAIKPYIERLFNVEIQ